MAAYCDSNLILQNSRFLHLQNPAFIWKAVEQFFLLICIQKGICLNPPVLLHFIKSHIFKHLPTCRILPNLGKVWFSFDIGRFFYPGCVNWSCIYQPYSRFLIFAIYISVNGFVNPTLLKQIFLFLHFCNHKQNRSGCLQKSIHLHKFLPCPQFVSLKML